MASFPKEKGKYHRVIFRSKGRSKTFYFKKSDYRRKDIAEWKKDRELEFKAGKWSPWEGRASIGTVTLKQVIEEYKERAKKELASTTYDVRSRYLDLFSEYVGQIYLEECTTDHANEWINQKLKFPTKKNRLKTLSVFFKWASKKYTVSVNEMEVVAPLSEKKKYYNKQHKAFIVEPQLEKIIANIRPGRNDRSRLADFYRLAFHTTRRRSDLLNIKPSWIFDNEPLLKVGDESYLPKSQIIEYVPLTEKAHTILLAYKDAPEEPIFNYTRDFVTKQFQEALEETLPQLKGIVSLHNLRDSGIMYLIYEKNLDLKHVMSMTGHSDLRSLQIYMKPWAEKTLEQVKML